MGLTTFTSTTGKQADTAPYPMADGALFLDQNANGSVDPDTDQVIPADAQGLESQAIAASEYLQKIGYARVSEPILIKDLRLYVQQLTNDRDLQICLESDLKRKESKACSRYFEIQKIYTDMGFTNVQEFADNLYLVCLENVPQSDGVLFGVPAIFFFNFETLLGIYQQYTPDWMDLLPSSQKVEAEKQKAVLLDLYRKLSLKLDRSECQEWVASHTQMDQDRNPIYPIDWNFFPEACTTEFSL